MKNPFFDTESGLVKPPSTAVIIFGATGDLTRRKLVPALYNLALDGYLPSNFTVIGVARRPFSDEQFRDDLHAGLMEHSRRAVEPEAWKEFSSRIYYQQVRFLEGADYQSLKKRINELNASYNDNFNLLYYLATGPEHFASIALNLKSAGLVEDPKSGVRTTSIVVEKPFGHDLDSARELNAKLRGAFSEKQLFRIDHYLGKETVQNILVFRFANGIFEPIWNRNYIDHIQISVCESEGVGDRGDYFDSAGILRDIVQNHLLQMLALLCIEPPASLSADAIRDEKVKVLKAIRPFSKEQVNHGTVRAAYASGHVAGKKVKAYAEEEGVAPGSRVETYFACELAIDNWRWSGVPIYIRAGKRLPKRITEITVFFKAAPGALFTQGASEKVDQNVLAIQVQPKESISLKMIAKPPGPRLRIQPVVMEFSYGHSFGVPIPEAYERLLLDALRGDTTLFTRGDEIEQAWDLIMPILDAWKSDGSVLLHHYPAGTWGPDSADRLVARNNVEWRNL